MTYFARVGRGFDASSSALLTYVASQGVLRALSGLYQLQRSVL
jgi:hypothetical protein